jgi:hypothetical protein
VADGSNGFSPLIQPAHSPESAANNAHQGLIGCRNLVEGGDDKQSLFSKSGAKCS